MTGISVDQLNQFGSKSMFTVTDDARLNLQKIKPNDISRWTGKAPSYVTGLRKGDAPALPLRDAVTININGGEVFKLDSRYIKSVFLHETAIKKLKELRANSPDSFLEVVKEIEAKMPGTRVKISEMMNENRSEIKRSKKNHK